ncbi:MAG: hypothetical protein DMG07_25135, partial [Acidobacteria bacterium]
GGTARPAPFLENRHYRLTHDETRAGIRSIIDKETGEELIDVRAPFAFDQLLYQEYSGIASQDRHRDTAGTAKPVQGATRVDGPTAPAAVERGELFDVLRWNAALTAASGAMPRIEQAVRVYHPIKRVELVNRIIGKRPTATTEGVYLAFPFRVPGGSWRIENAGVVWQPFADLLPGANPNVFSVGRWVSSENARHFVALAPLEAPLVEFGEIRSLRLDDVGSYRPRQEHVYAQLLNNFWGTNFPLWQGGDFTFSWAVTSGKAGEGTTRAAQLGQSVLSPPAATIVEPHRASLPASGSLLRVAGVRAVVQALKRSEDGQELVVRFRETGGQTGTLVLKPGLLPFVSAQRADALERPEGPVVPVAEGARFELRRYQILTLRLKLR